jgi:TatD family hydrolase
MQLVDTHCHIHEAAANLASDNPTHALWLKAGTPSPVSLISRAVQIGVTKMICVGTTAEDSEWAVEFVQNHPECWASIGIHPHEAKDGESAFRRLSALLASDHSGSREAGSGGSGGLPKTLSASEGNGYGVFGKPEPTRLAAPANKKIVAIGECGLDYFYTHSPKKDQQKALRFQIELALEHNLPLIFHVRDAFDDFWPIFDSYQNLKGVLHSFTDRPENADKALQRGLHIGINGIITFTKHDWQLQIAKTLPLQKILLETDAPFLTPTPHRGTVNEPSRVKNVAEFLATLRGETLQELAAQTTKNAQALFHL